MNTMISFLHLHWRDKFVRLCCLAAILCFAFASSAWTAIAAAPPLIVADDILTFSGGTVSPDNPDVYVIDMGAYTKGAIYSITINRPKGAQANYPVSIEYALHNEDYDRSSWRSCFMLENGEYLGTGVLRFAAGETTKTLRFVADNEANLPDNQTTVYLCMGMGSRTKAQYEVVKMNFTNPAPVAPATGSSYPDGYPDGLSVSISSALSNFSTGSYMFLSIGDAYWGHIEVQNDTKLAVSRRYIDHEAHPVSVSDSTIAVKQTEWLKPEQAVGVRSNHLDFLYKMTEDAIVSNYNLWPEEPDGVVPCIVRQADSLVNMKMAADGVVFSSFPVTDRNWGFGTALPVILNGYQYVNMPPRFGAITADAASYDIGATVVLTIPVLNGHLLQKLYPNNEWLENIDITLDGGQTFLNRAYFTFDGGTKTITALGEAINGTGSPLTVTAEVVYRSENALPMERSALETTLKAHNKTDSTARLSEKAAKARLRSMGEDEDGSSEFYLYGVNTSFTVTVQNAPFVPVESIDFTVPENGMVGLKTKNVALLAKVNPVSATFKTGAWTSSNPEIAEISANGVLTLKAYGKTSITFTSGEAAYRQANAMPANNETLVKSFDIYVVGDYPEWYISGGYKYKKASYEDARFLLSHNLRDNAWQVDGEIAVEVIHSDSAKYHSITGALEVTPDMIEEEWLKYTIPFNEQTFPKIPTVLEAWMADSIQAEPYRIVMSMPLKQTIGDMEMTRVLRDTFNVHITLPYQPVITLAGSIPAEALAGDTLLLQYDIKYLNKINTIIGNVGFNIDWQSRCVYSGYEGSTGHPQTSGKFVYLNEDRYKALYDSKGVVYHDPSSPPDGLELFDMGNYYNGVLTVKYVLPAPLGELREHCTGCSFDPYELFRTFISVENVTGFLGNHEIWGQVLYITSKSHTEYRDIKVYNVSMELMEIYSRYYETYVERIRGTNPIDLSEWDEQGYKIPDILPLLETANQSGDYSAFYDYMKKQSEKYLRMYSPESWGDVVAGITRKNSNDTIYTLLERDKFDSDYKEIYVVNYPFTGGDFDLVLKYPGRNLQKTYTYSTDSITGQFYVLEFYDKKERYWTGYEFIYSEPISPNDPVDISYINGNGDTINIVKNGNGSNRYVIYEPKGIIGQISYKQFNSNENSWLEGSLTTPRSMGDGAPAIAVISHNNSSIPAISESSYRNPCYAKNMDMIRVMLVDEDTGERITQNARINYLGQKDVKEYQSDPEVLVSLSEFQKWVSDNSMVPGDLQEEHWEGGSISYYAKNEAALKKVNDFYESKRRQYAARHISSFSGGYFDGTASTVSTSTNGYYFIPAIKIKEERLTSRLYDLWDYPEISYFEGGGMGVRWSKAHYAMEIVADGYYPKFMTYDADPKTKADGKSGITVVLRKNSDNLRQPDVNLWMENPKVSGMPNVNNHVGGTGWQHRFNGPISVFGIFSFGVHEQKDLSTKGRNTITTFSRNADTENAVLNITMPLANGWSPEQLKLTTQKGSAAPLAYTLISKATGYPGFENTYANLSYRLNNLVDYGSDEQGNPIAKNRVYPDLKRNGITVLEIPGLFNDEVDPKVYEAEITQGLKNNIQIDPGKFDVKSFGRNVDLGSTGKAMERAESFNFNLPSPLPFQFQTRTEGNRYYMRGIMSHNFINDIPLVGQANMGMELLGRAEEFEAAFNELKGALKMRPKNSTPRTSTISAFAGIRGYMEGYGEYDPLTHQYEYGINEGGISAELSASVYAKVPLGLVNVGVGVDGLVSATMGFSKPSDEDWARKVNNAKFDLWLETQLSLDVRADVSAGLDIGIAGVEVGVTGRGGFSNKNKVILKPYLPKSSNQFLTAGGMFNVYANMYAWAHAYFLFWSWEDEWKIFDVSKTWYYPDNNDNPYKRSPQLRSLSSVYRRSEAQLPGSILTDVAANVNPRYFGDGNTLLFQNLKTPANQNDDRISVYSTGSTADLLPDATLPAFGFDVASNASGATVVAYEQMSDSIRPIADKVSQETYISTQSGNVDVYAAVKNGDNWQTFRLSDVGKSGGEKSSDMSPKTAISPDGATAAAVWKSGLVQVNSSGAANISGNLLFSRYKNNEWSDPVKLMSGDNLGDYSLEIDGDSVVIAAMRSESTPSAENPGQYDITGKICLISISGNDDISYIETGRTGRRPQIARTGDNYYVSFMTPLRLNDTIDVNDIYMLAVAKNGQPIDSLSGFAGMTDKASFGYKLVGDNTAQSIGDLAIIYNAARVVNEGEVENSLLAAKFGRENGSIFTSEPDTILTLPDDGEQMLVNFDGYKRGNALKTAAVISNRSQGAIVTEKQTSFENRIVVASEAYNLSEMKNGGNFNVEFYVLNAGYKPVTSVSVSLDGKAATVSGESVMPGSIGIAKGAYTIVANNTDPVPYSIQATYSDGSTYTASGSLDLTAYSMKVNLLSLKTTQTKNTAVVEVVNNSTSPLTSTHEITVGVYSDIFGETLYPGTTLKTIPASELFGDDGSGGTTGKVATTAFDIPTVNETTSVYAIAKVKKNNLLRAGGNEDVEQTDKNYATIQLYAAATSGEPLKEEQSIELKQGWNWMSANVLNTAPSILDQMKESLIDAGTQIKGSSPFLTKSAGNWVGTLNEVSAKTMYQVNVTTDHTLKLEGTLADPLTTSIPLAANGWSWIGYTPAASIPVKTALAGLGAQTGDQIKAQSEFAQYAGVAGWIGSLKDMQPGAGYQYFSRDVVAKSFYYPNATALHSMKLRNDNDIVVSKWTPDPRKFSGNMTVTAIVLDDETEVHSGLVEIAAFAGNECRGSVLLEYIEGLKKPYLGFLTIGGEPGDKLSFKVYDHGNQTEYAASGSVDTFTVDGMYGNPLNPESIRINSATGIKPASSILRVYPNPVKDYLHLDYAEPKLDLLEINDMAGRTLIRKVGFAEKSLHVSNLTKGVYLLRVTVNGETSVHKFFKNNN